MTPTEALDFKLNCTPIHDFGPNNCSCCGQPDEFGWTLCDECIDKGKEPTYRRHTCLICDHRWLTPWRDERGEVIQPATVCNQSECLYAWLAEVDRLRDEAIAEREAAEAGEYKQMDRRQRDYLRRRAA